MDLFRMTGNPCKKGKRADAVLMNAEEIQRAVRFHQSFPSYQETPLIKLDSLAKKLGLKSIYVKDESYRFGLNSFKVLGSSYAIAKYAAQCVSCDISELTYDYLVSEKLKRELGQLTFISATDGNHGRGLAWACRQLSQKAVIYMPVGSSENRLEHIRRENAQACIVDKNYDDTVKLAAGKAAETENAVLIQDTAWSGYEEIPGWIMQGYGTLAKEADEQMCAYGERPTHIFTQAGVGSFAGAMQEYFASIYKENGPIMSVVEAKECDCLFRSASENQYIIVDGEPHTIMAGLNCGSPSTIAWEILKEHADFFFSCPDWVTAKGMRILSSPMEGDERVISGESGAVGMGLLACLMSSRNEEIEGMRRQLGLDANSVVLLFSTEGDTDPEKYESIVWDGECGSFF